MTGVAENHEFPQAIQKLDKTMVFDMFCVCDSGEQAQAQQCNPAGSLRLQIAGLRQDGETCGFRDGFLRILTDSVQ